MVYTYVGVTTKPIIKNWRGKVLILLCNYEYPPLGGGGGIVTSLLAQFLAKRHDVTVLTSQGLGLPAKQFENGVEIIRVPVLFRKQNEVANPLSMLAFIPMAIREGKKLLLNHRYDLINTHFVLPTGPVGDVLAKFGGIPNILTLHGGDLYDPSKFMSPHHNPLLRAWIRRLLRRADVVVGNSNNTLNNMRRYYTPEIEGIRIALGITGLKVEAANRRDYGCKEGEILLVTVGRLVARKAINQLISLMNDLRDENVRLLIIGKGPKERYLREECYKSHVADRVLFMGHVEENKKFSILKMCDIYVSTTMHEGFGLAFLEAMHSGLPIISYSHGGQNDFLCDNKTGFLIPGGRLDVIRERCRLLIRNPELRRTIGEKNKISVQKFYIEGCVSMYESIFKEVLKIQTDKDSFSRRALAL